MCVCTAALPVIAPVTEPVDGSSSTSGHKRFASQCRQTGNQLNLMHVKSLRWETAAFLSQWMDHPAKYKAEDQQS